MLINLIGVQVQSPPTPSPPVTTTTTNYILSNTDVIVIANAASLALTLPTAASAGIGRAYAIKNGALGANTTVNVSGGGTIDGSTSYAGIAIAYAAASFISNGSEWMVF